MNVKTKALIEAINGSGEFFVSKTYLKSPEYKLLIEKECRVWGLEVDESGLVLLRMTIMNPFFLNKETKTQFTEKLIEVLGTLARRR